MREALPLLALLGACDPQISASADATAVSAALSRDLDDHCSMVELNPGRNQAESNEERAIHPLTFEGNLSPQQSACLEGIYNSFPKTLPDGCEAVLSASSGFYDQEKDQIRLRVTVVCGEAGLGD